MAFEFDFDRNNRLRHEEYCLLAYGDRHFVPEPSGAHLSPAEVEAQRREVLTQNPGLSFSVSLRPALNANLP